MNQDAPNAEESSFVDPSTEPAGLASDSEGAGSSQEIAVSQPMDKWYLRPLAFVRRERSRRQWLGLLGALGVFVLGIGWWALRENGVETLTEPLPPSSTELFAKIHQSLEASDETEVRIDEFTIDDEMLKKLVAMERLTILQVECEGLSEDTFYGLAKMPKLEQLHLRGITIHDDQLAILSSSKTIWLLNLPTAEITPEAIQGLEKMPALRNLRLGIKGGDNRHGRAISTLSRLRTIHLIGVGVTDEGLQTLARMPLLESLYLDGAAVTEQGWIWLFQNNPQLHVHINQKHHDNDPQKH